MSGKEECDRIRRASSKKRNSHFTEAFTGLTVIRAFKKQQDFTEEILVICNET